MPAKNSQQLTRDNIFIFPSRFGFSYLAFVLLLFLLGTNYQNNVIILFSYLLGSFFITAMLHSFYNLSGLQVSQYGEVSGHVGQSLSVTLTFFTVKKRAYYTLAFVNKTSYIKTSAESAFIDVFEIGTTQVKVPFIASTRGRQNLERVKISSEYGFGLFTTWTQLDLNCQALIYPEPIAVISKVYLSGVDEQKSHANEAAISTQQFQAAGDDFYALQTYRQGESLAHIAWKQAARGQGWLSKQYQQEQRNNVWLTLLAMPANDLETKLSMLCFLVLEFHQQGQAFGLDLGALKIEPQQGLEHLNKCLAALACYQKPTVEAPH